MPCSLFRRSIFHAHEQGGLGQRLRSSEWLGDRHINSELIHTTILLLVIRVGSRSCLPQATPSPTTCTPWSLEWCHYRTLTSRTNETPRSWSWPLTANCLAPCSSRCTYTVFVCMCLKLCVKFRTQLYSYVYTCTHSEDAWAAWGTCVD